MYGRNYETVWTMLNESLNSWLKSNYSSTLRVFKARNSILFYEDSVSNIRGSIFKSKQDVRWYLLENWEHCGKFRKSPDLIIEIFRKPQIIYKWVICAVKTMHGEEKSCGKNVEVCRSILFMENFYGSLFIHFSI